MKTGKGLLRLALWLTAAIGCQNSWADTDVTELFLENWGFDTELNYGVEATGNVVKEIKQVPGWTQDHDVDYTIVGTYAFGTKKTFNGSGRIPATGYDGSAGCLALSTGWGVSLLYSQEVTLPNGSYYLSAAWYNGSDKTAGKSQLAWIPASGTGATSKVSSFPLNKWTTEKVTFTLTSQTSGKVQLGLQAVDGGSANTAKVVLDYVKIFMTDDAQALTLVHNYLGKALTEANKVAGTGAGVGLDALQGLIAEAQAVYDGGTASFTEQLAMRNRLLAATEQYQWANASSTNPLNITDRYIVNPSFEDGTKGWATGGMSRQSNSNFTKKQGTYYMEKWTGIGSRISDVDLNQKLSGMPTGKYRLTANALHIQQSGSGSVQNTGSAQTGGWLYAGNYKTAITRMDSYSLDFTVGQEDGEVAVGVRSEGATGNWLTCDNFTLYYLGGVDANALRGYLEAECNVADELLMGRMQSSVRAQLTSVLAEAKNVLADKEASDEAIQQATKALKETNALATASAARYEALDKQLTYAKKVLGWWKGVVYRQNNWDKLQTAITTADSQVNDEALSDEALASALSALTTATKAVDKGVYESGSAVGKGDALNNPDNTWCNERSMQSKHWIVYWEKGYGSSVPSNVEEMLSNCDKYFELYADKLGFIKVNEGKSKTDKYKMIIRLKYKDEWEANGSGIDNQIGMLTLSRWAFGSRGGQTAAHEVGHCFQYQVHCDKGDWNGWMYNWTNSPGGNCFWEMCAQWMAYQYYTGQKFSNEWLNNSLNNMHKHVLDVGMRYENYFMQDYLVDKQKDMTFIGRLWNECKDPEDPLQTYMRIAMTGTAAEKLSLLGDEMWEMGARMATFDFDHLRTAGAGTIGKRNQANMIKGDDLFWTISPSNAPENFGNNAIKLNVPGTQKKLVAEFEGMGQTSGYRSYKPEAAGWRVGFVALKTDGTRVYGDMARATLKDNKIRVEFECPAGTKNLWLIVSGAPTTYWCRGWGDNLTHEQWPYRVRFFNTNLLNEPTTLTVEEDVASAKARLRQLANAYKVPTANIGNKPFQYNAQSVETLKSSIESYKEIADKEDATLDELNEAIMQIAVLPMPELNQPESTMRFTITNVTDGFNARGKAVTYINDREDEGNYSIRYLAAANANYAQAFCFTPVAGKKDCYNLSQTDKDGKVRYLCPGTVYGGNSQQIRTTTVKAQAGEYIVNAMSTEGNWYLWNVAANNYVSANSSNSDNGLYTSGSFYKMSIADAQKAVVDVKTDGTERYSTIIVSFKAKIPEGLTAYSVAGTEGDMLTLREETVIEANTPYIIYSNSPQSIVLEDYGTASQNTYSADYLTGVLSATSLRLGTSNYTLTTVDGVTAFHQCEGTIYKLDANTAYLTLTGQDAKQTYYLDDNHTAIAPIEALVSGNATIYDLSGRKRNRLEKGINIVNGRKVLVK